MIFLADSKTGKKPIYLSAAAQAVLVALPRLEANPYIIAGAKDGAPRSDLKKPWAALTQAPRASRGVRLHDLRHSFASFGAGASLGLPIIGKLLGHSQAATTQPLRPPGRGPDAPRGRDDRRDDLGRNGRENVCGFALVETSAFEAMSPRQRWEGELARPIRFTVKPPHGSAVPDPATDPEAQSKIGAENELMVRLRDDEWAKL